MLYGQWENLQKSVALFTKVPSAFPLTASSSAAIKALSSMKVPAAPMRLLPNSESSGNIKMIARTFLKAASLSWSSVFANRAASNLLAS